MPRSALSQDQVEDFRDTLCAAATRLFAEQGYGGVTMRALARRLGCSPMTPYRYFQNKAEIFEAVRSAAAQRFGEAIEAAVASHAEHVPRLRAICHAYVGFALDEPHAYRIMFELDAKPRPERQTREDLRGWLAMNEAVAQAIAAGVLEGQPNIVAHLLWSGVHGLVALHLAGMLAFGMQIEELVEAFLDRELARGRSQPDAHSWTRAGSATRARSESGANPRSEPTPRGVRDEPARDATDG